MICLSRSISLGESLGEHSWPIESRERRLRRCVLNRIGEIAVLAKDHRENSVEPLHEIPLRAKVLSEPIEAVKVAANSAGAGLLIDGNIGLTKCVDRLHWIANIESRTLLVRLPCAEETGQQFDLNAIGVLKLIDKNVPDSIAKLQA